MKIPFQLKLYLDRQPKLYLALLKAQRIQHWSKKWIVTQDSHVVIEGFPRSGNSFALSAFQRSNPDCDRIATHVHMSSQIIVAAQYDLPTIALLREPIAAVSSLMALSIQIGDRQLEDKAQTVAQLSRLLNYYTTFYNRVFAVREKVLFAPFEQVTQDFGAILHSANKRWKKNFAPFEHTPDAVDAIFKDAPVHLGPRSDRDAVKQAIMSIAQTKELEPHRQLATEIYLSCKQCAATHPSE